jgi:hypothetical protein
VSTPIVLSENQIAKLQGISQNAPLIQMQTTILTKQHAQVIGDHELVVRRSGMKIQTQRMVVAIPHLQAEPAVARRAQLLHQIQMQTSALFAGSLEFH